MGLTFITYKRQKLRAVLLHPGAKTEHGHTRRPEGGPNQGPTAVPVLEGQGVPVDPVGPVETGVGHPAEADPVVGGESLGDVQYVLPSQCHHVFETGLTGRDSVSVQRFSTMTSFHRKVWVPGTASWPHPR